MMSHMCVDATVRAAFDKGYDCMVAHDACAAKSIIFGEVEAPSDHVHAAFMGALGAVYAKVLSCNLSGYNTRPRQSAWIRRG